MKRLLPLLLVTVATVALFFVAYSGFQAKFCKGDGGKHSAPLLVGTWRQRFLVDGDSGETDVTFDKDGRGTIWSYLLFGANGATAVYYFSWSMEDSQTVTINYDTGGSDTLHLSLWSSHKVSITVEGASDWFRNGILIRDN